MRIVKRSVAERSVSHAGDGPNWRTFLNRADSPGATNCPLWPDHLGGTCAPANWP